METVVSSTDEFVHELKVMTRALIKNTFQTFSAVHIVKIIRFINKLIQLTLHLSSLLLLGTFTFRLCCKTESEVTQIHTTPHLNYSINKLGMM